MHSATFTLLHRVILERKQVTCMQGGHYREFCPHILGHKDGRERLLAYQFGGETSSDLPPSGEWRCFSLDTLSNVTLRTGRWYSGSGHHATQTCIDDVYIDVNTDVPDQPGRREPP